MSPLAGCGPILRRCDRPGRRLIASQYPASQAMGQVRGRLFVLAETLVDEVDELLDGVLFVLAVGLELDA